MWALMLPLTDQTKILRLMLGLKASKISALSVKWKYKVSRFVDCVNHSLGPIWLQSAEEAEKEVCITVMPTALMAEMQVSMP